MLSFVNMLIDWNSQLQTEKIVFLILLTISLLALIVFYFYDKHKYKREKL